MPKKHLSALRRCSAIFRLAALCGMAGGSARTWRKAPPWMEASPMGEPEGECPVRLKKDVKEPALLPKKPDLQEQAALPVTQGP